MNSSLDDGASASLTSTLRVFQVSGPTGGVGAHDAGRIIESSNAKEIPSGRLIISYAGIWAVPKVTWQGFALKTLTGAPGR